MAISIDIRCLNKLIVAVGEDTDGGVNSIDAESSFLGYLRFSWH